MLAILLQILLAATAFATVVEKRQDQCPTLNEDEPWYLYYVEMFNATDNNPNCESWICFHFCDANPGNEIDTECPVYVNGSIVPGDDWYYCQDDSVRFQIQQNEIVVERGLYEASCPDGDIILTGNATTDWSVTPVQGGDEMTIYELRLPVTQEPQ